MSVEKIIASWEKKSYKPIYWIEGEEDYYVDLLVNYAEKKILSESEASFNLTIFYGKDVQWGDILVACRKYPMFSDRQVVVVKEAQQLRDIEKLEPYIQMPLSSTILVVALKDKKLDARTKFAKLVKDKTEYIRTMKVGDNTLPEWLNTQVGKLGFGISPKANALMVDHIGNDLSRIKMELEKIIINVGQRKSITEEDVETYVGISKEFNVFELQAAIASKNFSKAIRIIQYFASNPNLAPIQKILPSLYAFFSKVYMVFGVNGHDSDIAAQIGVPPFFVKNYTQASASFGIKKTEEILLLLHQYNLKSIGINAVNVDDAELLKELVVKILILK